MELRNLVVERDRVTVGITDSGDDGMLTYDGNVNWSMRVSANGAMTLEVSVIPREAETPRPMLPPNLARR